MYLPIPWLNRASKTITVPVRPNWRKLHQGLVVAGLGEMLGLVFGLLALLFLGPLGGPVVTWLGLTLPDADVLGLALAGLFALLGYLVALLGRTFCLFYAPPGHGARRLQFACLLCSLVAPGCFVLAHFLGGAETYAVLRRHPTEIVDIGLLHVAVLLQLAGLLVGLLGVLLFSGFTRAVGTALRDESAGRMAVRYFWFVGFLLGGTLGLVLEAQRSHHPETLPALAAGWLICLLWHTLLVQGTARRLAHFVRLHGSRVLPPRPVVNPRAGQVTLRTALPYSVGRDGSPI
jgi:hypothetical protein